eukprot:8264561-Pyramimonas_sp.AAC.1
MEDERRETHLVVLLRLWGSGGLFLARALAARAALHQHVLPVVERDLHQLLARLHRRYLRGPDVHRDDARRVRRKTGRGVHHLLAGGGARGGVGLSRVLLRLQRLPGGPGPAPATPGGGGARPSRPPGPVDGDALLLQEGELARAR